MAATAGSLAAVAGEHNWRGLSPAGFEGWVRTFYEKMLLA